MHTKHVITGFFLSLLLAGCARSPYTDTGSGAQSSRAEQSSSVAKEQSSTAALSSIASNGAVFKDGVQPRNAFSRGSGAVVYRYSISAPAEKAVSITGDAFTVDGSRWDHPSLKIYTDPAYSLPAATWKSKDNWTQGTGIAFTGKLSIPAGETRYMELHTTVSSPAECPSLTIHHAGLSDLTVKSGDAQCLTK